MPWVIGTYGLGYWLVTFIVFWQIVFWLRGYTDKEHYAWSTMDLTLAKFNPISFWHIFVFGMLLARLFVDVEQGAITCVFETGRRAAQLELLPDATSDCTVDLLVQLQSICTNYGACLGYTILLLFFVTYGHPNRDIWLLGDLQIVFRNGFLLPAHAALLWGLSMEKDPLAKLFTYRPFCWAEHISYPQYILQAPVFEVVHDLTFVYLDRWQSEPANDQPIPWKWKQFYFLLAISLFSSACLGQFLVVKPYRFWIESQRKAEGADAKANATPPRGELDDSKTHGKQSTDPAEEG